MEIGRFIHKHRMVLILIAIALALAAFSITFFQPQVVGDSPSYVEAMGVLTGLPVPEDFVPNRILTTFGGLVSVLALAPIFGILPAWLLLNVVFYVVMALASFYLFKEVFEDERIAFLGSLFVIGNYAPLVFGLAYLMDMGGWAFLLLSFWGVARFIKTGTSSSVLWAAAAVGAGGLFKEYALLGCIAIAVALILMAFREPRRAIPLMPLTAAIALTPVALVHIGVYQNFGYTYLDWTRHNAETYVYSSRVIELIKSFGSLTNLLAPLTALGAWIWGSSCVRTGRAALEDPKNMIVAAVIASALPVFFWGGITQRVLFVAVPALALVAGFLFERRKQWWTGFLGVAALYVITNISVDFLLATIDLPL